MTTFYLKPTAAGGSDANPGDSPLAAWASLSRAAQRTWNPGDRLLIAPATYPNTGKSEFRGGGDPDRPVIIAGDGGRPTIVFDAALDTDPKFILAGVGFHAVDIACTQPTRAGNADDRLMVTQPPESAPGEPVSDCLFLRCQASESYQTFKAADAPRSRFIGCEAFGATIALGFVGTADGSIAEECLFRDFSEDGVQTKGGLRDAIVRRCTIVGDAVSGRGITLGGSSTFVPGNDWGRPDADYEAASVLAESNVIIGVPGKTLYAAILFQGAKNCAAMNNTIVGLPGCELWTDGVMDAFDTKTSGGSGWDLGAPQTNTATIAGNLIIYAAATMENHQAPLGTNVFRDNRYHLVNWMTGNGNGWAGTWTDAGNGAVDPLLTRYAGITDWRDLDLRLGPDSPARGIATLPRPLGYDGAPLPSGADRDDIARGPVVDAGAYDATARRQRKQRHPVRRGRR